MTNDKWRMQNVSLLNLHFSFVTSHFPLRDFHYEPAAATVDGVVVTGGGGAFGCPSG